MHGSCGHIFAVQISATGSVPFYCHVLLVRLFMQLSGPLANTEALFDDGVCVCACAGTGLVVCCPALLRQPLRWTRLGVGESQIHVICAVCRRTWPLAVMSLQHSLITDGKAHGKHRCQSLAYSSSLQKLACDLQASKHKWLRRLAESIQSR